MVNAEVVAVGLIVLNGGKLVGRTRLQKQAYLLHRCGGNLGLRFNCHRYGPCCFELVGGLNDARAEGRIEIEERIGRHGVAYAVCRSGERAGTPQCLGDLEADGARNLPNEIKGISEIVLELAATIVFQRDEWDCFGKDKTSPVEETRKRKPLKATDGRMSGAQNLLHELGLNSMPANA